jgi:hypothetical protein
LRKAATSIFNPKAAVHGAATLGVAAAFAVLIAC